MTTYIEYERMEYAQNNASMTYRRDLFVGSLG